MIKVGQVYQWLDGRRMTVRQIPALGTSLYGLEEPSGLMNYYFGHEIIGLGMLTKVQPGQIWVHQYLTTLELEIVSPLSKEEWIYHEVGYTTDSSVHEDYLLDNYILTSLVSESGHGSQICPRCGATGACVLMQIVACMNPKCPCYTTKTVLVP